MGLLSSSVGIGIWRMFLGLKATACSRVVDRGSSFDGSLSGYNTECLTVYHSGQHVWRLPCSLHAKDLFCRFQKEQVHFSHYERQKVLSLPNFPLHFQWQSKDVDSVDTSLPSFLYSLYIIKLVLVLNIADIMLAGR